MFIANKKCHKVIDTLESWMPAMNSY